MPFTPGIRSALVGICPSAWRASGSVASGLAWHEIAEISIDETSELRVTSRHQPETPRRLSIRRVPNLLLLDGILRASQEATDKDPLDVAPQRGALFDGLASDVAGEGPGGSTQLLPGSDGNDDADDPGLPDRPRRPK